MLSIRQLRLVPMLAALALLASTATALADCMMPPPIQEAITSAEIVFVGTVTATTNRSTWAEVQVEEVWRGPDLPARVVVKGGPEGNAATSVDRSFEVGLKYLFFPFVDPDAGPIPDQTGGLMDNSCTSTTAWSAELIPLRPADVREPLGATTGEAGFDLGGLVAPLALALLVAGVLLVVGLVARGRQSD